MNTAKAARARQAAEAAGRAALVKMLVVGGAERVSAPVVRVMEILAEAGVFRTGGVLVGTQAFGAYGNLLGVHFSQQALRTQDIDIAQDLAIGIALARDVTTVDIGERLAR